MASRNRFLPVLSAFICLISSLSNLHASVISIPKDYPTIQQGIDAAYRGDTVMVAQGVYFERPLIQKRIVLASRYIISGDRNDIDKTIIDGGGEHEVTIWIKSGGIGSKIIGLKVTHGLDGIKVQASNTTIADNHITENGDGIDYSAVSGGICARNLIENSVAEAIDIDDQCSIIIEDNIMRYNRADGVEIQLQNYTGTTINYIIRRNIIHNNLHDGIQLVENPGISNRSFLIEHNLIYKNGTAGIGMMAWGNLFEKYEIAAIKDPVQIFNNTIASNSYGVVGGDNVLTINNIIIDHKTVGMRHVYGNSMAAYNLMSGNPYDFDYCKYDSKTTFHDAPDLDDNFRYRGSGPGVNQATDLFVWKGRTVLQIPQNQYSGIAPDMGAYEYKEPDPPHDPGVLHVPGDFVTLQEALNKSVDEDTILVAPGEYIGEMRIRKNIILASQFFSSNDSSLIEQTIIDGDGGPAIVVDAAASGAKIIGFSIRNASDGIITSAVIDIRHNHISQCGDGVDYEPGSGGTCAFNRIENNSEEGIDLHRQLDITIENNIIRNNGNDGIQIRLSETAQPLIYRVRRNQITANGQDGIQLIDDGLLMERVFFFEYNTIDSNAAAAIGMVDSSANEENFAAASLKDRIYLFNNTLVANQYGVTGGDNIVALNNLIISTQKTALKHIDGASIVAHGLLWNNGTDFEASNVDSATIISSAPNLDNTYHYTSRGPGVNQGTDSFVWDGETVLSIPGDQFIGKGPDIGAFEFNQHDPGILHVPGDFVTLQEALNKSIDEDTILVAPGEYVGEMRISKNIILASQFFSSNDSSLIEQTIIDGDGGPAIVVDAAASGAKIIGFSIRNASDGIITSAVIDIRHNHISQCGDGVDYEPGSGGTCAFNRIENNSEEGIDLHRQLDITIENNIIRNNGNDGIQIRLSETAQPLIYRVRRNQITANGQDGIQLIDDGLLMERVFFFEYNTIDSNAAAAIGMVDSSANEENFAAASLKDRIYLFNNTLVANQYGVTGGDNIVALNNLIISTQKTALKHIDGASIVAHGLLWNNGTDFEASNVDSATIISSAPNLDNTYHYTSRGPGVNQGTDSFVWDGETVLSIPGDQFIGKGPDIGAFEFNQHDPGILHVPGDFFTLQEALNKSVDEDTILVAPGEYVGEMRISKNIILASQFFSSNDSSLIEQTIIDGDGGPAIVVDAAASGAQIIGFSIRNAYDGIITSAVIDILHNHISQCGDGVDYEPGSGGTCAFNRIENNSEEGIDLYKQLDIAIENNIIRNNGNDGIQIRLSETAQPLTYHVRRNQITANGQDGIQLIDDGLQMERVFFFEYNTIDSNAAAAIGMVDSSATEENFAAASLKDRIYLFNNTLVANQYGVTGGDNIVALNNLIISTQKTALKHIDGASIVAHGLLWNNGTDFEASNVDSATIMTVAPSITVDLHYDTGSLGIDGGVSFFVWQGDTVLNLTDNDYLGTAPDIGAFEYVPISSVQQGIEAGPADFALLANYPNPFNAQTRLTYSIPTGAQVTLYIYNRLGQLVRTIEQGFQGAGVHAVNWDGRNDSNKDAATGIYFYVLQTKHGRLTQKLSLIR